MDDYIYIPGGLFTIFFLWGLWEWSKRIKKRKTREENIPNTKKKLDNVSLIAYMVIAAAIIVLVVVFIALR